MHLTLTLPTYTMPYLCVRYENPHLRGQVQAVLSSIFQVIGISNDIVL